MEKRFIVILALIIANLTNAQVGINTSQPKATLDIEAKNTTGTTSNTDGILIPRVDRQRALNMSNIPPSTLIYIDNPLTGTQSGIAINIDAEGFYFFDGILWSKIINQNNIKDTEINIYNSNGIITGNRVITQNDKTLTFVGTANNAFSIDGNTFSVDANSDRVGIGTTTPNNRLDLGSSFGNDGLSDVNGKKLAVYNNSAGNDFYGLGISSGNLQLHAASTPTEAPGMILNSSGSVGIGVTTSSPASSAILELSATNKGFLPPRLTTAQRNAITNVPAGLMIYNTTTNCMDFWNSSTWVSTCAVIAPVQGTITSLVCGTPVNNGVLRSGTIAVGVTSTISYIGGNGGSHGGQTVTSTGITGLTATLSAGSFINGNGTLTYAITGTPSTTGNANFAVNIGGQTCNLTIPVQPPAGPIVSLNCSSAINNGKLVIGNEAFGVTSIISYTGGNGSTHSGQTVTSTGVTGLTATLTAGNFANGNGSLIYTITGTPSATGTASFVINIGGQVCTLTRAVVAALPITCTTEGTFANPNDPRKYYRCVRIGGVLYTYEFTCPNGSLFDNNLKKCIIQ